MKSERHGHYEVQSDGTSVWVNGPLGCVARFGLTGYEYNNYQVMGAKKGSDRKPGTEMRTTNRHDWYEFVGVVTQMFKLPMSDTHRPTRLDAS